MATVQSIIDRAKYILKDPDHVRWTLEEHMAWIQDAIDQIASMHPRAASQYVALELSEGARQDLRVISPETRWIRLQELTCNMNEDLPNGPSIRQVSRPALDNASRNWRAKPLASEVKEYAMDEREVYTFDVYPPVVAGTRVYALASIKPPRIADEDDEFPLADGYDIPALDMLLFRAFSKDANDASYAARAAGHFQAFQIAMGVETSDAGA